MCSTVAYTDCTCVQLSPIRIVHVNKPSLVWTLHVPSRVQTVRTYVKPLCVDYRTSIVHVQTSSTVYHADV